MEQKKITEKTPDQENSFKKILLVEDNPSFAIIVKELFENNYQRVFGLEWVQTLEDTLSKLDNGNFDVVILDLGLPDSEGLDTFFDVLDRAPTTPIVIFTAVQDKKMALQAIRHGAQDYLIKGEFQSTLFFRAVQYAVQRKKLENELFFEKERLSVILESIGEGLIATDKNLKVTLLNPVGEMITGWTEEEALGKDLDEIFNVKHVQKAQMGEKTIERIALMGKFQSPFHGSLMISKEGKKILTDGVMAPIYTHTEEAVGLIIVFHDAA